MHHLRRSMFAVGLSLTLATVAQLGSIAQTSPAAACEALLDLRNLTLTSARLVDSNTTGVTYCYVKGILSPAIGFHTQLPLPDQWNGRYLTWGDGGKDGDLDFADARVAEGYAVANSNTGHDNGVEPGSSFGWHNRQAEIDFGYRAVHLTTAAGKALTRAYYGTDPEYSYFEGINKNLPHSYDSRGTWFLFWQYLGLIILFWSVRDWLAGARPSRSSISINPRLKRLLFLICLNGGALALECILQRMKQRLTS